MFSVRLFYFNHKSSKRLQKNTYTKTSGYNINIQKSITFQYTHNKHAEQISNAQSHSQ